MNIFIYGDHSKFHCGSKAVIVYLKELIGKNNCNIVSYENADVVLVNGEGTMHHSSKGYKQKMELLKKAQFDRKKTVLLNSVWEQNDNAYDEVLKNLNAIIVREEKSQRDLFSRHKISSDVCMDLSYFCPVKDTTDSKVALKEEIRITDFYSEEFGGWVRYSAGSRSKYPYLDMKKFGWSDFVSILNNTEFLITGRHHAVFASCKAKTPFIALESNSHKISGFVEMAGLPIPVCTKPREIASALKWAKNNINVYHDFFDYLDSRKAFSFDDMKI